MTECVVVVAISRLNKAFCTTSSAQVNWDLQDHITFSLTYCRFCGDNKDFDICDFAKEERKNITLVLGEQIYTIDPEK